MEKAKPLVSILQEKPVIAVPENYPKCYVNPLIFSVLQIFAPGQIERIQYLNRKEDVRKWFVVTFDCIRDEQELADILTGYEPCTQEVFEKVKAKSITWFVDYAAKYGYSISKPSHNHHINT